MLFDDIVGALLSKQNVSMYDGTMYIQDLHKEVRLCCQIVQKYGKRSEQAKGAKKHLNNLLTNYETNRKHLGWKPTKKRK